MKHPYLNTIWYKIKGLAANPVIINILTVGVVTFLIKIIAFYKETLIAATFGLSLVLDTFFIAVLIPGFIQNVFIGALNSLFIPNYITEQHTSKQLGAFQTTVLCIVAAIMAFFTILTYLSSDLFIESVFPGKSTAYYGLVRSQLLIVLPSLIFMGFSSVISGLLEIKGKFFFPSLIGFLPPLTTVIAIFCFRERWGDLVLAYGFLFGSLLPFIFVIVLGFKHGVIQLAPPQLNHNSITMLKQLPAKLTSGIFSGINPFVDQYFAAQLAIGSIAAIQYGVKIPFFVSGIVTMAIGPVILPHFSRMANMNRLGAFRQMFLIVKNVFLGCAIIVLVLIILSYPVVHLIYERGEFTAHDSEVVARLQQIALVYVPFTIVGIIMVKFLTSINQNAFMAYTALFNLIANLILNIIFVKQFGLYGLTLSTTFVAIISSGIFFFYTRHLYKKELSTLK